MSSVAVFVVLLTIGAIAGVRGSAAYPGFFYYTPDTYPDSTRDFQTCGLSRPGLVCDPNRFLGNSSTDGATVADGISAVLSYVRQQNPCRCADREECEAGHGTAISIALLRKINTDGTADEERPSQKQHLVSNFAHALRSRQQRSVCQDDVLIVLSLDDNVLFTAVGAAAGTALTQDAVLRATERVVPFLQRRDFNGALLQLVEEYGAVLQEQSVPQKPQKQPWYHPLPFWSLFAIGAAILLLFLLVVGGIVACCVLQRRKRAEYHMVRGNERHQQERL